MEKLKIVVKVEINTLLNPQNKFDKKRLEKLAMVLSNLMNSGIQVFVVSSGAIFLGSEKLGLKFQPGDLIKKQAIAAVGQAELMKYYRRYFNSFNQITAQVLLTGDVLNDQVLKRNATNTLKNLVEKHVVPIINENDSVSTEDIEWNDNYYMVKNVAEMVSAHAILVHPPPLGKYLLMTRGDQPVYQETEDEQLIDNLISMKEFLTQSRYLIQPFSDKPEFLQKLKKA